MSVVLITHSPDERSGAPRLRGSSGLLVLIFQVTLPYMDTERDKELVEDMEVFLNGQTLPLVMLSEYPMETRKRFRKALDLAIEELSGPDPDYYVYFDDQINYVLNLLRQVARMIDSTDLLEK